MARPYTLLFPEGRTKFKWVREKLGYWRIQPNGAHYYDHNRKVPVFRDEHGRLTALNGETGTKLVTIDPVKPNSLSTGEQFIEVVSKTENEFLTHITSTAP